MPERIVVVTIGQPSTNPRMMKEVEALIEAGYQVKVFYAYWAPWGAKADELILARYPGVFHQVAGDPVHRKQAWLFSRIIHKGIRVLGRYVPALRVFGINRPCYFLYRAAMREQADLYIGHNLGALPIVVKAARRWKTKAGFDAEDYHRGQFLQPEGEDYKVTVHTEEAFMPACDYLTTASPQIGAAYEALLPGRKLTVVNNVFSIRGLQPGRKMSDGPLRLLWFSQSLGPNRGLEVIVEALNLLAGHDITLDLIGDCPEAYRQHLTGLSKAPERISILPPVAPEQLFGIAARYDIGLAAEVPTRQNSDVALANKIFTYLLAGNGVMASDTKAQRQFLSDHPDIGWLYKYDDPQDLADRIAEAYKDRKEMHRRQEACLALAAGRYNWEMEKKIFLTQVSRTLEKKPITGK